MSEPSIGRDPFEVLAEEFLARYRAGERPSINDLATRYPDLAEQIRELLPALVMVEQDLTIEPDQDTSDPSLSAIPDGSKLLGDYRLLREIGRGGMGIVYEAEQVSLGRRVALKVLPGRVTGDRRAFERFRREAKAGARLHHTNIVPVFDVGHSGDVAYFAMQFIQGQGLDQVIEELRLLDGASAEVTGVDGSGAGRRARPDLGTWGARSRNTGQVAKLIQSGRFGGEGPGSLAETAPGVIDQAAVSTLRDPSADHDRRASGTGPVDPSRRPRRPRRVALGGAAGRDGGLDGRLVRAAAALLPERGADRSPGGAGPGPRPRPRHRPPRHQAVEPPA